MRPSRPRAARAGLLAVAFGLAATASACGAGSAGSGPTLPTVNPTPKLVLTIHDDGITAEHGPRADDAVVPGNGPDATTTVPGGTLAVIRNDASRDHRLRAGEGGKDLDTGILHPGEQTQVVFVHRDDGANTLRLADPDAPAVATSVVIQPRP